jgi:hypothetical protein
MISHNCPRCRHELQISDHLAGLTVVCPECRERIPVPAAASAPGAITAAPPPPAPRGGEYVFPRGPEPLPGLRGEEPLLGDEPLPQVVPLPRPRWPASLYALVIVAGVAVFLADCFLAWLVAGRAAWIAGLVILGAVVFLPGFGLFVDWLSRRRRGAGGWQPVSWLPSVRLPRVLYGAALWAAWLVVGVVFAWSPVHVDNFSPRDVRVYVDGEEWATSRARTTEVHWLRRGTHTLTIRALDTGEELESQNVVVTGMSPHVLNVLRAQVYARGSITYADVNAIVPDPPPEQAVRSGWFRPDVDYLFEEPPAEILINVRSGGKTPLTTKTYLLRRAPLPPQKQLGPGPGLPQR